MTTKNGWRWDTARIAGLILALAAYAVGHADLFPPTWRPYVEPASSLLSLGVAFFTHSPLPAPAVKTGAVLALALVLGSTLSACGGSAPPPGSVYATAVRIAKRMCVIVDALPDPGPAPTSGGEQ